MTMQVRDVFTVFGESLDIVATTGNFINLREFGLKKKFVSTACWRGYWCRFSVDAEKGLLLNDLHISPSENRHILLNGKQITAERFGLGVYKDVDMPLPFSGKVLFGKNLLYSVDSYMCEAAWGYETLIELQFDNGKVVGRKDLSSETRRFQRIYRLSRKMRDVTESYEYDDGTGNYNVKLWWLSYVPSRWVSVVLAPVDWLCNVFRRKE